MRRAALDFCEDLQARREPRWLSLLGPSGTGKTMLARIVSRYVVRKGRYYAIDGRAGKVVQAHETYFASWPEMVDEMKRGDFSTAELLCEKKEDRRGLKSPAVWFAVIDDIGQIEDTSKAYLMGTLTRMFDARLGAWTIWTSNLTFQQIAERFDERIASRMLRGANIVVENKAVDFNLR